MVFFFLLPFYKTRNPVFGFLLSFIENFLSEKTTIVSVYNGYQKTYAIWILNTSTTNAFRSSQRDMFCKTDISIDITKNFKNICERGHFK